MTDEERALRLAADWQRLHDDLHGLQPHAVDYGGYWWATFRPPGAAEAGEGGIVLLIDVVREAMTAASASIPIDQRISDYEQNIH